MACSGATYLRSDAIFNTTQSCAYVGSKRYSHATAVTLSVFLGMFG